MKGGASMAIQRTTLDKFGENARELIQLLKQNPPLSNMDKLYIENHLEALQLAYGTWKRRVDDVKQRGSGN